MKSVALILLISISLSSTLSQLYIASAMVCAPGQNYAKVIKGSGDNGHKETYSISGHIDGQDKVVVNKASGPSNQNVTREYCFSVSSDGVYRLVLTQSEGKIWNTKSFITITGDDDIVVFSGSLYLSTSTYLINLAYIVRPGCQARSLDQFDENDWTRPDYIMTDDWTTVNTAMQRTVPGNHINRIAFDYQHFSHLSHIVLRVYYRFGIGLWFNGQRLYRHHLAEEDDDEIYMWTMSDTSFPEYTWQNFIVPASLLFEKNNVIVLSAHYPTFDNIDVNWTVAVFPVFPSFAEDGCSSVRVTLTGSEGLKAMENNRAEYVVDGRDSTQALFASSRMAVTLHTTDLVIMSEYSLFRDGEKMVKNWRVMNCGDDAELCSYWRLSSAHQDHHITRGRYRYTCDGLSNLPSRLFRFELLTTDYEFEEVSINEFTPYVCGIPVDKYMYPTEYLYVNETKQITITPVETEPAVYKISPSLPSSLMLHQTTGVISGTTEELNRFNSFTIVRENDGMKRKYLMVIVTENVDAPTVTPTIQPSVTPTVTPTISPTDTPSSVLVIVICIVIIVVIITIIIAVWCCCKPKTNMKITPIPMKSTVSV